MRPTDTAGGAGYPTDPAHREPGAHLDALRTPLSAILGQSQLLKRRFLQGQPLPPDDYLAALSVIERSVWAIEGHLRVLQDSDHHAPDGGNRMTSPANEGSTGAS